MSYRVYFSKLFSSLEGHSLNGLVKRLCLSKLMSLLSCFSNVLFPSNSFAPRKSSVVGAQGKLGLWRTIYVWIEYEHTYEHTC
jgi:hypothetical protein